jgi:hypothetical protein
VKCVPFPDKVEVAYAWCMNFKNDATQVTSEGLCWCLETDICGSEGGVVKDWLRKVKRRVVVILRFFPTNCYARTLMLMMERVG